jgi:hypothetical protein
VGCSCVRARPIPAASGGRLRHRTGPPFAITAGVPLAGAWRLGERSPAVAHCLLWVVEKGGDCKHCFAVEVHEGRLLERVADLRSLRKLGPERSIRSHRDRLQLRAMILTGDTSISVVEYGLGDKHWRGRSLP